MKAETGASQLVIVGGGTAGWMTALYCQQMLGEQWQICLIESDSIATIGVGEGTTPFMRQFFRAIQLEEAEWMPACDATYKCGIRFPGWSSRPDHQSYYHPFFSALDLPHGDAFFSQANARRRANPPVVLNAQPEHYFLASYLSSRGLSPASYADPSVPVDYAYHFDAGKLGHFLRQLAVTRGVRHCVDTVSEVFRHPNGDIAGVMTQQHGRIAGDFFIDCSGFRSLLIEQTLGDPFVSFASNLFNDAAVAVQTPLAAGQVPPTETRSEAMPYGWMWQIPLTRRQGNGYVYSSAFCDADQAEQSLRQRLGVAEEIPCRHLSMRVGRRTAHIRQNCMAVGLSQGFIEPLEATALMLVQFSIQLLVQHLRQAGLSLSNDAVRQNAINQRVNQLFDGVRDYIVAHYKTNSRTDTDYWLSNRHDSPVSGVLADILQGWRSGEALEPILERHSQQLTYLRPSWYCLLAGVDDYGEYHRLPHRSQSSLSESAIKAARHYEALVNRFTMPDSGREVFPGKAI